MALLTNYDRLTSEDQHLGSATCAILNVNAGSKAFVRPGGVWSQDACMFEGNITCVHIEGDSTLIPPWNPGAYLHRGPYVQYFDGTDFQLLGSSLDPDADSVPGNGDRTDPHNCRIATDGTDLFVVYYDYIVTDVGTGAVSHHVRICHWNGSSWDEVATETMGPGVGALGGTVPALTVAGGKAYVVYAVNGGSAVRIFRSDGTAAYVDGSFDLVKGYSYHGDADGTFAAVTTTAGRPVGFYTKNYFGGNPVVTSLVAFDLDTAAVIRETATSNGPNALVPSGATFGGVCQLTSSAAAGYDGDKIVLGTKVYGPIIVPEDFSSDPIIISAQDSPLAGTGGLGDGLTAGYFSFSPFGTLALDPGDPNQRQLWMADGIDGDPVSGFESNPTDFHQWRPACGSNAANPRYQFANSGSGVPLDRFPDDCLFGNSFFWALYGPVVMVADGTYVYAFWCYYPGTDSGDNGTSPYWFQFIVTRWTIAHDAVCADFPSIVFNSRFKVTTD